MKKIKVLTAIAAALCMVFAMSACGAKAETETTEAASTSAQAEETAAETESSSEAEGALNVETDFAISFNGTDVKLGDNINDVKDALGDEIKPSEKVQSCVAASSSYAYYYNGLTIEATESGTIYQFDISDTGAENTVETIKGIKIGSTVEDVAAAYGAEYIDENNTCYFYTLNNSSVQIDFVEGAVSSMWIFSHSCSEK